MPHSAMTVDVLTKQVRKSLIKITKTKHFQVYISIKISLFNNSSRCKINKIDRYLPPRVQFLDNEC